MIYHTVPADQLLTQGDILADCPVYRATAEGEPARFPARVVVLTQACDLAQAKSDLAADGQRVCRVLSPYREHLAQHFAVTYMRIALPEPYETRP